MKKYFTLLCVAGIFAACAKEAPVVEEPIANKIVFNIDVSQGEMDTKAVKTNWESGDVVYLFFKGLVGDDKYAVFTFDGGVWNKSANGITTEDIALPAVTADKVITAVYFPFGTPTFTANGSAFDVTTVYSYYMYGTNSYTTATVDAGTLTITADVTLNVPDGYVQFSMPVRDSDFTFFKQVDEKFTLDETHDILTPCKVSSITPGSAPDETNGSAGDPLFGYCYGSGINQCILFSGKTTPSDAAREMNFVFMTNQDTVADADDVTYLFSTTKILYTTAKEKRAVKFPAISSSAWKVPEPPTVTINGYKWAAWNIGATKNYQAGEGFSANYTFPRAGYDDGSPSGDNYTNHSYNIGNDVANFRLGSKWRLPDSAAIDALVATYTDTEHYTWSWKPISNPTGVRGYEVWNNSDEEHKLFLPSDGWGGIANMIYLGQSGLTFCAHHTVDQTLVSGDIVVAAGTPVRHGPYAHQSYLGEFARAVKIAE